MLVHRPVHCVLKITTIATLLAVHIYTSIYIIINSSLHPGTQVDYVEILQTMLSTSRTIRHSFIRLITL